jgi:predicted house-cleaning noncanonical NTP pyrophosphatase (MazG superfamily)/NTP pyrophosphatase (non-canonical NTP hydrolase)
MRAQRLVAAFLDGRDLETDPAYRLLDLASEVGEVAGDAAKSSEYGADPDALAVADDELCDALLSLLALAESFDLDAEATLEVALDKYQRRIAQAGDASSDVEANDQTPITHEADDEEYETLLGEKLVEEAREFRESGDAEELADVLAVVDAVREHRTSARRNSGLCRPRKWPNAAGSRSASCGGLRRFLRAVARPQASSSTSYPRSRIPATSSATCSCPRVSRSSSTSAAFIPMSREVRSCWIA